MKKLSLLLTVLALAFSAQADMMWLHSGTLRQSKNNQVTTFTDGTRIATKVMK